MLTLGAREIQADSHVREFAKHTPGLRYPDAEVFRRLEQCVRKAGKVLPTALQKSDCPRTKLMNIP